MMRIVSIRRADQGALEPVVAMRLARSQVDVSIRRADQGALEPRGAGGDGGAAPVRFNPPGGSGSLGTTNLSHTRSHIAGFNPPGGSGSLGTWVWALKGFVNCKFQSAGRIREPWNRALFLYCPMKPLVSIRRADQGALEPRNHIGTDIVLSMFQSAGRIREPWNCCL